MGSMCPVCGPGPGAPVQPRLVSRESAPQRWERRDVRWPILQGCWPLSSHLLDTPARPAGGRWEGALPAGLRVLAAGVGPGAGWRPVGAERLEGGEPGWAGDPGGGSRQVRQMLPIYRPTIPPGLWGEAEAEWPWGEVWLNLPLADTRGGAG